jgi:MYXO-CTERM domain-containing protein
MDTVTSRQTATPPAVCNAPLAPQEKDATRSRAAACMRWLLPIAVVATALAAMTDNRVDTDLWGHVLYGREAIQEGQLPETTTWSYVTNSHPWINHENIAELAMAWAADSFGILGLTLGKLLLGIVLVGSLVLTARIGGAGWMATGIVLVAAAETMEFHWHFRPQAFTYAYFAVMLAVLAWAFRDWRGSWRSWSETWRGTPVSIPKGMTRELRWLLAVPFLMILWTNTHGGFAAGLAIFCALLGLRAMEAWAWWGRESLMLILRLGMFVVMAIAATFLNPYGADLHAWMVRSLGVPRPEVSDWRPLAVFSDPDAVGMWLLLGLAAAGAVCTRRRPDWVRLLVAALTLWQAVSHCRHLMFFAMLCGAWLPPLVDDAVRRVTADARRRLQDLGIAARTSGVQTAVLAVWCVIMIGSLVPKLTNIPVRRDWYPVTAMQFVRDHKLQGRFLVDFNWAQYAIMCFANEPGQPSRVAIDGRFDTCYPKETMDVYLDFAIGNGGPDVRYRSPTSPPFDADRALEIGDPNLALLWREQRHAVSVMERHRDEWTLLYQDELAQLWGRRAIYDNPQDPRYLAESARMIGDAVQKGAKPWPALPIADAARRDERLAAR